MRITTIDLFKADIPLKDPFRIAVMEMRSAMSVFLRINTDAGLSGYGEASSFWKLCGETQSIDLAAAQDLAKLLINQDPLAIEDRMADLDGFLKNNSQIRAAFDMALYDILARAANLPLYQLLGGSSARPLRTCLTLGINPAELMAEKAAAAVSRGFQIIKIKLGTNAKDDIARVRAIRSAIGPTPTIRVDANQGWDVPTALAVLTRIHELDIEYCEQPVPYWNLQDLKAIHTKSPVPIVADESVFDHHDAFRVLADDACDYVNLKLSKSGGIRTGQKLASVVDAAGRLCMIGCMMESRLGLTAAAHLASSMNHFKFFDLDSAHLLATDPIIGGMTYQKDLCLLNETPGLGVTIDAAFLEKCPKITI
ncbi:MAG TPA: dipeptide epimerase [Tepidisphaeraceae bacterium]|jgi:L-alanine-DL-glutamate epimerase-like enolase superfamily enzyme|nr:dipeptide epimerase [Tepidisphaeraceae bacterium]